MFANFNIIKDEFFLVLCSWAVLLLKGSKAIESKVIIYRGRQDKQKNKQKLLEERKENFNIKFFNHE